MVMLPPAWRIPPGLSVDVDHCAGRGDWRGAAHAGDPVGRRIGGSRGPRAGTGVMRSLDADVASGNGTGIGTDIGIDNRGVRGVGITGAGGQDPDAPAVDARTGPGLRVGGHGAHRRRLGLANR